MQDDGLLTWNTYVPACTQDSNKIPTAIPMFFGAQLSNENSGNAVRPDGKKLEVENPRWRPVNLKYVYLGLFTR